MPLYELVYLVNPKAALPTVAQVMKRNAQVVFENKGVIRRLDNMGILPLAYPMYRHREKHFKGRWVMMLFDASPTCVKELNEQMRKDQQIFRWACYKQKDQFRQVYEEQTIHEDMYQGEDMLLTPQNNATLESKTITSQTIMSNNVHEDELLIQSILNEETSKLASSQNI
ncbi:predicted protein [Naegleria gruberi]|uniref:Predicted protein n=1 Tax=Naegleria gruberi TaxID=5762 RepID=D2V0A3_NAEGR|nr:uncharacterized protein NAEGRDRAFT_45652 [Naegleria gruberi]EFC49680.1 predicted protein [Naegleria gruberi]|eukprot:XP_002682424.1 predicted protein [Naegleria gruberi strain NEG-M]